MQRTIEDVQSEAANAAEMKAAASGNPLILMQVQLASDLRKLEALYSQHQRGQHRLRDRVKQLSTVDERLARAEAAHAENIRRREANTRTVTEKGKEKIRLELRHDGKTLTDKDSERMKELLRDGVKEVTRNFGKKTLFGSYRGFEVYIVRHRQFNGDEGFRFALQGAGDREFQPDNLTYGFEEKFSLTGLFQRLDNFLAKGLDEGMEAYRENARRETAELDTVKVAMGKEFPQKDELTLVRENHSSVIRELQRMQDDTEYVSTWEPKTSLDNVTENSKAIKNVAIIGSRAFNDYAKLESVVMDILKEKGVSLPSVTIVSGGAQGADSLGRDFAQKHGLGYLEFLPDWDKFGKRAGVVRNADIVKNSDFVVAFWDGQSKGTRHSLEFAQKAGKPCFAYNFITQKEAALSEQENPPPGHALAHGTGSTPGLVFSAPTAGPRLR